MNPTRFATTGTIFNIISMFVIGILQRRLKASRIQCHSSQNVQQNTLGHSVHSQGAAEQFTIFRETAMLDICGTRTSCYVVRNFSHSSLYRPFGDVISLQSQVFSCCDKNQGPMTINVQQEMRGAASNLLARLENVGSLYPTGTHLALVNNDGCIRTK